MEKAIIRITRDKDFFGIARKLKVYIDGKHAGGVRWNKSVDFPVSPGMHLLYVKMDWCKSIPITLKVKENDLFEYQVISPASESVVGVFKQLPDMMFNYSDFFDLKRVNINEVKRNYG